MICTLRYLHIDKNKCLNAVWKSATRSTSIQQHTPDIATITTSTILVMDTTDQSFFPESLTPSALQVQANARDQDTSSLVWDLSAPSATTTSTPLANSDGTNNVANDGKFKSFHAKIYLKRISNSPSPNTEVSVPETAIIGSVGPPHPTETADADDDDDVVEASILQYQRQQRKSQAAKRAGTKLTQDQLQSNIIYQDNDIICVNKPAGVLTVPGINAHDSMANLIFNSLQKTSETAVPGTDQQPIADDSPDNPAIDNDKCPDACSMAVHRLDMDTSGLVVYGKTKSAVSTLHQVFRRESENSSNQNGNDNSKKKKKQKQKNRGGTSKKQKLYQEHLQRQQQQQEEKAVTSNDKAQDDDRTEQIDSDVKPNLNEATQVPTSATTVETTTASSTFTKSVIKEYEALVCGHLPLHIESGHIDLPLQKDIHHPPFMRVSTPHSESLARQVVDALRARNWTKLSKRNPKQSQTNFRVMGREYYYECAADTTDGTANVASSSSSSQETRRFPVTRLSLTPVTGRTHQLRVHCAAMGFPIVGDPAYGIYGESAFCGGLYHNNVEVVKAVVPEESGDDNDLEATSSPLSIWRASLALQKEMMEVYPPGEKNMCLHAKRLGVPHPTTGERMLWENAPSF